jgi:hypothetical protein
MKTNAAAAFLLRALLHCFLLGTGVPLSAQTASLSGVVKDSSNAVIPGARVTAMRESTRQKQATSSSEQGFYHFAFLLPGAYTITVEAAGFQVVTRPGAKLDPGQEARLDFTLALAELKESVTVHSTVSSLQTESSAVGTEVDPQLVQDLPLNGRTFQSLIGLAPGVVRPGTLNQANPQGGAFINGQRTTTNYFSVDGVSVNLGDAGGSFPVSTVLGTTHSLVAVDDLQEFKLYTSTYSAEFGRAVGGQLEVVTRSGSTEFHGSAFDYFRNEALDANDWFSNASHLPRAAHRQNDFGGVFGGPLFEKRTFFFLSYEGLRLKQPFPFETMVPSLSARQAATGAIQQLLNAYSLPSGPEDPGTFRAPLVATASDRTSSDNTSVRIDHLLNQRVTVFGRYSEAPSEDWLVGFGSAESLKSLANFRSATAGATLLLSPKATSDLRLNYSRAERGGSFVPDRSGGAVPPPDSLLFPAPFASPASSRFTVVGLGRPFSAGRASRGLQRQANLVGNTSILQGGHDLRFGIDYRYLAPHFGPVDYLQGVFFAGVSGALAGMARRVLINSSDQLSLGFQELALYGQDRWRVAPRFTLIYGLRWEPSPPPHAKGHQQLLTLTGFPDLANVQLAPVGTPVYETTYDNFGPRVGAAYQLSQSPGRETVIRGGFGIYYQLGLATGASAGSFPHVRSKSTGKVPYPLSSDVAAPPALVSLDPPYNGNFNVFGPGYVPPRSYHWNFTVDQRLGSNQSISISYLGEAGRNLLRQNLLFDLNPRFSGSRINIITNASSSDYHALQVQFQRHMTHGLAALVSYTWSHSIDDTSDDVGGDNLTDPRLDRGASDFDARHTFNAAFTLSIPARNGNRALRAILNHWSTDGIFTARTALPINVLVDLGDLLQSDLLQPRPDRIPGVPLYVHGTAFPGGRRINPEAFAVQQVIRQGNLERNLVRGFPLAQLDFAIRRQFDIGENWKLQWRTDFFNLLNHPSFGLVDGMFGVFGPPFEPNANFGIAAFTVAQFGDVAPLYSVGAARSIQLSLRLRF